MAKQKTIFVIRLSEDGVNTSACTNVKALFNEIAETGYRPTTVNMSGKEVNYSYTNLRKTIRERQRCNAFTVAYVQCEGGNQIEIMEVAILKH